MCSTCVHAQKPNFNILKEEYLFQEGKHFNQCHASTIAETADGKLLGSWFGGTHEGNKDVVIWGSISDGQNWTKPTVWAEGVINDTLRYPCWNPVLFKLKNDKKIYLYYKVGPNPREWWGMVKTSVDGGITWSSARQLPHGILGPIKNKPIELADGTVLSPSSVELSEDRWVAHIEASDSDQKKWEIYPIDQKSKFNVIQPSILLHPDDKLQVLCRSKEGTVVTAWSRDNGLTWSALEKTNLINPNSATDAIRVGSLFYIVYNPDIPGKDWWEGRTKLNLAYSRDGIDWIDLIKLEDEEKGEFSYPTIFQDSRGLVHITYTYNRKNIKHIVLEK
ncbi:sialidase [Sphingobacterium olei]|uniref:Sialidase n=1 Tax=Sphingobacterium olei TaxID=2571155 RepID=A0A4U0P0Y6_9SPHI|nr:sialidase [Sphingobacterium olei]